MIVKKIMTLLSSFIRKTVYWLSDRSSRLSFWAIPSPTHTGNVPPATMQSWLLRRHQSYLLRKRLRGSSHSRKNWEDRRTHLALARGPRSGAAPEGPAAKPRAGSQSQPRKLKGCLLPPDAQPASPLQPVVGGDIQGLVLESPCTLESDSGSTSYSHVSG